MNLKFPLFRKYYYVSLIDGGGVYKQENAPTWFKHRFSRVQSTNKQYIALSERYRVETVKVICKFAFSEIV